jgi:hypothetical protein
LLVQRKAPKRNDTRMPLVSCANTKTILGFRPYGSAYRLLKFAPGKNLSGLIGVFRRGFQATT